MHRDTGRHDTGWGHPEHQGRLPAIVRAIEKDTPALLDRIDALEAQPCPVESLLRVHTQGHVETVRRLSEQSAVTGELMEVAGDTVVSSASWDAAIAAAGCAVDAATRVARGETNTAFALCRPPGHHASADRIMGFCLFNNVAVAARVLQQEQGVGRILIVDWDVHHGNGTQDIFYDDPTVFYLSLHQHPWYPGTGMARERGLGAGEGTTRNVPIAGGTGRDAYLALFSDVLNETFAEFKPEIVLVSAGYDCLAGDPLGSFLLEPPDLHGMTQALMRHADACGAAGVVALLEGGYAPHRVGQGIVATLHALCGLASPD